MEDIHHPKGGRITRTQANEGQTDSLAMWKHKWGLQGQDITCVSPWRIQGCLRKK